VVIRGEVDLKVIQGKEVTVPGKSIVKQGVSILPRGGFY